MRSLQAAPFLPFASSIVRADLEMGLGHMVLASAANI